MDIIRVFLEMYPLKTGRSRTENITRWINDDDCTGGLVGWYNGYGTWKLPEMKIVL